jgi:hypothetical protein
LLPNIIADGSLLPSATRSASSLGTDIGSISIPVLLSLTSK